MNSFECRDKLHAAGFPYSHNVIMAFIGGSTQHGAKLDDGQSDEDLYGIFVPPKEKILGIDRYEHFCVHEPQDIALHSVQKWMGLAAKGNPTVISFLFSEPVITSSWWMLIQQHRADFIAKSHLGPFLGYANEQLERLMGSRGQKNCNRTFLEQQYGYDTKYAMHIIRLLGEGKELMQTGTITYPRPEKQMLLDIRKGMFKLHEILEMAQDIETEAKALRDISALPENVDRSKISSLSAFLHLEFYREAE